MPLELESYLNAPRISEIEPFPAACAPGTVYVRHFVGRPRRAGASRPCRSRSATIISRASRRPDKPRRGNFLWPFSVAASQPTRGRHFEYLRQEYEMRDGGSAARMKRWFALRRVIKAFSVPVDNESTEGSVIYDYHCNESPWVFAQQIVLSCISMNVYSEVESITAMLLGNISA